MYGQPVECRSDTARQLRLKLGVTRAVREMREPGLSRANLLRGTYSLRHAQMRRVRLAEQCVEDEDIDPAKGAHRIFRQLLRVGDVSKIADAVAINGSALMESSKIYAKRFASRAIESGGPYISMGPSLRSESARISSIPWT